MHCPRCGNDDVRRSRRQGIMDAMRRQLLGKWPYFCAACQAKFSSTHRYPPSNCEEESRFIGRPVRAAASFVTEEASQPVAELTIRTQSHEQMDWILLALDQAVSSYQRTRAGQTEPASREIVTSEYRPATQANYR